MSWEKLLYDQWQGCDLPSIEDELNVRSSFVVENMVSIPRADLDEWRNLFEEVASVLQAHYDRSCMQSDEDLAVLCEEAAAYIQKVGE